MNRQIQWMIAAVLICCATLFASCHNDSNKKLHILFVLDHLRMLYGTQPTFFAVDTYTQELDKNIHFSINQKSKNISAKGSLITIQKGSKNEYQLGLALTFKGETEAQSMYENFSEEDMANYNKIVNNFIELLDEWNKVDNTVVKKMKVIYDFLNEI